MKIILSFALVCMIISLAVFADDDDKYGGENRGKNLRLTEVNAKWQQECGACHIAYAPGLLPAASWRKLMSGLDKHFNTDASLTPQENREITDFLVKNASTRWSAGNAPLRITESQWFKRKHDSREIAPAVWKRASIKSPANCQACHIDAEKGDFSERNIKIPR